MPNALCVFAGPEAEIEANDEHVGDVVGSGARGVSCCGDDGVHNSQGGGLLLLDGGIEPVGLELLHDALVELGMRLRVGWCFGVRQTIQEVGCCNRPPCLRN